jgi:hypothetical protein
MLEFSSNWKEECTQGDSHCKGRQTGNERELLKKGMKGRISALEYRKLLLSFLLFHPDNFNRHLASTTSAAPA